MFLSHLVLIEIDVGVVLLFSDQLFGLERDSQFLNVKAQSHQQLKQQHLINQSVINLMT